jgi:hypothetical protein
MKKLSLNLATCKTEESQVGGDCEEEKWMEIVQRLPSVDLVCDADQLTDKSFFYFVSCR